MRSRHKRTNNEHGHFTIINYMQKKTQKRDNSLNMGTFINEVCISCLQLLKTLYVHTYVSCFGQDYMQYALMYVRTWFWQESKKFSYIPRFWLYIDRCKESPRSSFYIVFYPEFETSVSDGSIKHNVDTRYYSTNFNCIPTVVELNVHSFFSQRKVI